MLYGFGLAFGLLPAFEQQNNLCVISEMVGSCLCLFCAVWCVGVLKLNLFNFSSLIAWNQFGDCFQPNEAFCKNSKRGNWSRKSLEAELFHLCSFLDKVFQMWLAISSFPGLDSVVVKVLPLVWKTGVKILAASYLTSKDPLTLHLPTLKCESEPK